MNVQVSLAAAMLLVAALGADGEVDWAVEHGVPVHRLPLAWSSTTALVQLRSWLDGLAVGTEVER